VGDTVQIKRAGDVIPQVIGPVPDKRDGTQQPWTPPALCPSCQTPVARDEDGVGLYCPNVACPGRQLEGLVHFAARDCMDVDGCRTSASRSCSRPVSCTMRPTSTRSPWRRSWRSIGSPRRARRT
jgi:NAD-dependent DNA ligase